jgi:hypothetical protein
LAVKLFCIYVRYIGKKTEKLLQYEEFCQK